MYYFVRRDYISFIRETKGAYLINVKYGKDYYFLNDIVFFIPKKAIWFDKDCKNIVYLQKDLVDSKIGSGFKGLRRQLNKMGCFGYYKNYNDKEKLELV